MREFYIGVISSLSAAFILWICTYFIKSFNYTVLIVSKKRWKSMQKVMPIISKEITKK